VHPLNQLAKGWLDAIFPGSCLLCASDSRNELLCPACATDLPSLPAAQCPQCAEQTTHGERCGACLQSPPHFDRAVAAYRYDFPVDRIVQALKYGHQLAVAGWLAQALATRLPAGNALIVALPLHRERLRERGFNQSWEIAQALGKRLQQPVDGSSLLRTRATPPQAELPWPERQRNVRGAFECTADLSGREILLIDDVMTTGATVNEAARVLKLHGASRVTVAVAARALKH
jgi:ComF family protein